MKMDGIDLLASVIYSVSSGPLPEPFVLDGKRGREGGLTKGFPRRHSAPAPNPGRTLFFSKYFQFW